MVSMGMLTIFVVSRKRGWRGCTVFQRDRYLLASGDVEWLWVKIEQQFRDAVKAVGLVENAQASGNIGIFPVQSTGRNRVTDQCSDKGWGLSSKSNCHDHELFSRAALKNS